MMKQYIYKSMLWLIAGSLLCFSFTTIKKDYKRTIKKEFDLSKNGELEIDNKFGTVDIKTWNKDQVSIEVTIVVRADSKKESEDMFDRISIHFSNDKNYVKAETEIASKRSSSWWGWGSYNNSNDYAINYDIYMPETADLELNNDHGETLLAILKGDVTIDIAHGELSAEGFEGELEIDFAHSDGNVGNVKLLKADIAHSDIRFGDVEEAELDVAHADVEIDDISILRLDSRHADIELGQVEELRAETRHDDIEIESVETLITEAQHTSLKIDRLGKLLDLDCSHGGTSIDHLAAGFQSVNLYGSHHTFRIQVDGDANFQLDASGSHSGISYPSDMNVQYEKDKNSDREVRGYYGNANSKGASTIKARLSHGGLRLRD